LQPGSSRSQRIDYSLKAAAKANASAQSYLDRRRVIAPRDPRADMRQIDLTAHYTAPLTDGFSDARRDFGLQAGLQKFGETTFDVRGLIQLFGREPELRGFKRPEQVVGIQVHQRAARLHLLHAEQWPDSAQGEEIAALTIHYANGRDERLLIQHAVHVASDSLEQSPRRSKLKSSGSATALANLNQNQSVSTNAPG
jgi:hypothetical protein